MSQRPTGDGEPVVGQGRDQQQSVDAFAALKLGRTPRLAHRLLRGCATRSPKGEAWWARQDSNLQPDRYERRGCPGMSWKDWQIASTSTGSVHDWLRPIVGQPLVAAGSWQVFDREVIDVQPPKVQKRQRQPSW